MDKFTTYLSDNFETLKWTSSKPPFSTISRMSRVCGRDVGSAIDFQTHFPDRIHTSRTPWLWFFSKEVPGLPSKTPSRWHYLLPCSPLLPPPASAVMPMTDLFSGLCHHLQLLLHPQSVCVLTIRQQGHRPVQRPFLLSNPLGPLRLLALL